MDQHGKVCQSIEWAEVTWLPLMAAIDPLVPPGFPCCFDPLLESYHTIYVYLLFLSSGAVIRFVIFCPQNQIWRGKRDLLIDV